MMDIDLAPLWHSWDVKPPSLAQAHRLVMPEFGRVIERTTAFRGEFAVGDADLQHMPEHFRSLLGFPLRCAFYMLNPLQTAKHPEMAQEYLDWQREKVRANVDRLRSARGMALDIVLSVQVDYAGEKAAANCFSGARWHLIWALSERPSLLADFLSEPRLQRWKEELLVPAAEALKRDPEFFSRLAHVITLCKTEARNALDVWRGTPVELSKNPFYKFVLAALWISCGYHERGLRLSLKMCQAWREDAMV